MIKYNEKVFLIENCSFANSYNSDGDYPKNTCLGYLGYSNTNKNNPICFALPMEATAMPLP
jgi:hypothetical protein